MADRQVDRGLRERGVSAGRTSRSSAAASSAAPPPRSWPRRARRSRSTSATRSARPPRAATRARSSTRSTRSWPSSTSRRSSTTAASPDLELPDGARRRADAALRARARSSRRSRSIARDCPELEADAARPGGGAPARAGRGRRAVGVPARDRLPGAARWPPRARSRGARYAAGARFHEGETAWPWVIGGRARGVLAGGVRRPAGAVLVAAGPWTPEVIDTDADLAADRAGLGRGRRGRDGRPAAATCSRRWASRTWPRRDEGTGSIFSLVAADGEISVGLDLPHRGARAGGLGRPAPARRRALRARARAREGRRRAGVPAAAVAATAGRSWASCAATRASGPPPATGRGASRPGPATARIVADALLGGPRCRRRCRSRASRPRVGGLRVGPHDHGVGDLDRSRSPGGRRRSAWPRIASSLSAS